MDSVKSNMLTATVATTLSFKLRCKGAATSCVDEFPQSLDGPACWNASNVGEYVLQLTADDLRHIDGAVKHFHGTGKPIAQVSPISFPLPEDLSQRLRSASREVHNGKGFVVIRGIDPASYDGHDNALVFAGLSVHVAPIRSSNRIGGALDHIRDARADTIVVRNTDPNKSLSAAKLPHEMKFHADGEYGDIIAMYVKSSSEEGGAQHLSSFWTVYNKLQEESPETLSVLAEDVLFPGEPSILYGTAPSMKPFIYHHDGKVICQMNWNPFVKSKTLTATQRAAMLKTNEIAKDCSIKLDQKPGDIQFINNFCVLHARDSYRDSRTRKRHIMRMGLRDPEYQWPTPDVYSDMFNNHFQTPVEKQKIVGEDVAPLHPRGISTAADHG